jgi:hypothetical protein
MSNSKFSPRELKFLELYFSGFLMKDAAKSAGYRGSSDPAICNTGRAVLTKFEQSALAKRIFCGAGVSEGRIAALLIDMALNSQSESGRMKGLSILSRALFSLDRRLTSGAEINH